MRRPAAILVVALVLAFGWMHPVASQDAAGTPAETPVASPAADAPRIELEFTELNDSGVTGGATLFEDGDQTIVELDLDGTGEDHPAHIHEGTCDDIEPQPAFNLQNIGEDGESISLVDAPLQELIDGDYVIDLHRAPNELGTLIVCAGIEGTPEVPGTATPSTTEEPTEEPTTAPEPTGTGGEVATEAPTPTPTPEPTEEPTPTPAPTEEPATAPEPTGTGGEGETPTPAVTPAGDGTDGGKGLPLGETSSGKGSTLAVGGASSTGGDGTTGSVDTRSGKGDPTGGTSGLPETTGTGSSLIFPSDSSRALPAAAAGISILLFAAGWLTRRGVGYRR
ncbi:MAG TPA: hypothetical protein VD767_10280 [Thermomicrobiales bacterium]|nr:hypothetical protein [Thermomicrobiales bacterium]